MRIHASASVPDANEPRPGLAVDEDVAEEVDAGAADRGRDGADARWPGAQEPAVDVRADGDRAGDEDLAVDVLDDRVHVDVGDVLVRAFPDEGAVRVEARMNVLRAVVNPVPTAGEGARRPAARRCSVRRARR